jgi:hypothetical protein
LAKVFKNYPKVLPNCSKPLKNPEKPSRKRASYWRRKKSATRRKPTQPGKWVCGAIKRMKEELATTGTEAATGFSKNDELFY